MSVVRTRLLISIKSSTFKLCPSPSLALRGASPVQETRQTSYLASLSFSQYPETMDTLKDKLPPLLLTLGPLLDFASWRLKDKGAIVFLDYYSHFNARRKKCIPSFACQRTERKGNTNKGLQSQNTNRGLWQSLQKRSERASEREWRINPAGAT